MSRRITASLFMLAVVAVTGALLYARYRPQGYRYDFTITSRTEAPGQSPRELRWAGYGLERRQDVLHMKFTDGAMDVTKSAMIPAIDSAGGFTSLRRHNKSSWLGDGGEIAGYPTRIFRYVDHDTLYLTDSAGRRMSHANRVVTDYYVASDVGEIGRRFSRFADSINLVLAGLQPHQARERVRGRQDSYDGVPLRIVSQVSWVDGVGARRTTTTESRVDRLEKADVARSEIHQLARKAEAARGATRRNGWEYAFRIRTEGGDQKGEAPLTGTAEVMGDEVRVTFDSKKGVKRDRSRRGEYLIVSDHGRQIAMIRPHEKEFNVVTVDSLARGVSAGLNAVSRFVDVRLGGLEVGASQLGAGDSIAGYATQRYRMTQAYRIDMKILGARPTLRGKLTTDFWVSPALDVPGNPFFDFFALLPNALALQSPDYVRRSLAERTKMFETLPLKTIATLEMTDLEGKVTTSVSTIEVTSVKRATLDPRRFEIPSSYKATKGADIGFQD